jgi:hypothetical protein
MSWESWIFRYQIDFRVVLQQFQFRRQDFYRSAFNTNLLCLKVKEMVEYLQRPPDPQNWMPNSDDLVELFLSHRDEFESRPPGGRPQSRFFSAPFLNKGQIPGRRSPGAIPECEPESENWLEFLTGELDLPEHPTATPNFLAAMKVLMGGGDGPGEDEFWNDF